MLRSSGGSWTWVLNGLKNLLAQGPDIRSRGKVHEVKINSYELLNSIIVGLNSWFIYVWTALFWGPCLLMPDMFITARSHGCHDISDHRKLNCLFKSLFRLTPRKTHMTILLSLCEGNPLVSNGPVMHQNAPFHNIFMMFLNSCIKSTHQDWNKMAAILQITLSNSFSCIEAPNAIIFFQENASVNIMCQKAAIFVWSWSYAYVGARLGQQCACKCPST